MTAVDEIVLPDRVITCGTRDDSLYRMIRCVFNAELPLHLECLFLCILLKRDTDRIAQW
jgi:hypothetical protein